MNTFTLKNKPLLSHFFDEIDIQISKFDLNRCDERTLYLTITIEYKAHKTVGDLIFLIDKEELYGAISLNEKYNQVRHFFLQHFKHELLYRDELYLAETLRKTPTFKQCLKKYAEKYPKHMKQKFLQ